MLITNPKDFSLHNLDVPSIMARSYSCLSLKLKQAKPFLLHYSKAMLWLLANF